MFTFKAIKPGKAFQSSVFRDEIRTAAVAMSKEIKADFEKTTATWDKKPRFKVEVEIGRAAVGRPAFAAAAGTTTGATIAVTTTNEVYGYVDEGTKKHLIKARRKGALAFPSKFRPKTKPKVIGSTAGSKGGKIRLAKVVHHPGTKARQFTKVIHKKWQPLFRKEMGAAITRAAKRSGHGA